MGKTLGLLAATLVLSFCAAATAQAGVLKLDRSFSGDGRATAGFGYDPISEDTFAPRRDRANAIGIQPDGKLVVAGVSECATSPCSTIALLRYGVDGKLDREFGQAGKRNYEYGEVGTFEDLAIMEGGGLQLVGRSAYEVGTPSDLSLTRFTEDGQLDETFGEGGIFITGITGGDDWNIGMLSVGMLPDGDVAASGWIQCGLRCNHWMIGRFGPDGEASPEFGGKIINYSSGGNKDVPAADRELSTSIAVDAEGRMVVAGPAGPRNIQITRILPDGTVDQSFGRRGFAQVHVTRRVGNSSVQRLKREPQGVTIAPDGSIFVAAGLERPSGNTGALLRLDPNGMPDPTFGRGRGFIESPGLAINDLSADRCGRIVVGGTWSRGDGSEFGMARYSAKGILDKSFGGVTRVKVGRNGDAHASSLQLFGRKLFMGGRAEVGPGNEDFATIALKMPRNAFRCGR